MNLFTVIDSDHRLNDIFLVGSNPRFVVENPFCVEFLREKKSALRYIALSPSRASKVHSRPFSYNNPPFGYRLKLSPEHNYW